MMRNRDLSKTLIDPAIFKDQNVVLGIMYEATAG